MKTPNLIIKYEFVTTKESEKSIEQVYDLIFSELENKFNVSSFSFKKDENNSKN